jgi:hypothetical protein
MRIYDMLDADVPSLRDHFILFLCIYNLFNDTFSISDYIPSDKRMIVNNKLERMRKKAAVA